jgi:hypothetical protein
MTSVFSRFFLFWEKRVDLAGLLRQRLAIWHSLEDFYFMPPTFISFGTFRSKPCNEMPRNETKRHFVAAIWSKALEALTL